MPTPRAPAIVAAMNTAISLALAAVIAVFFGVDWTVNDGAATLFLGREMFDLIEYVAFWR